MMVLNEEQSERENQIKSVPWQKDGPHNSGPAQEIAQIQKS